MAKYARVVGGSLVDVTSSDPKETFHPDLTKEFINVPETAVDGAKLVKNVWVNPGDVTLIVEKIMATDIEVGPIEFKLLFTIEERIHIDEKKKDDAILKDFFSIIDDPRLKSVNLGLQSTKDAVKYLVSIGIVEEGRVDQILSGQFK